MTFSLPNLPYSDDALEPIISKETISYHYAKHHQAYVTNLNNLIVGTDQEGKTLEAIIQNSSGGLFNNAAQVWNHTFYWNCLCPNSSKAPKANLAAAIDKEFGSFDAFKEAFSKSAIGNFGSGWTWLVKKSDQSLAIINTDDADTVITQKDLTPLLVIDVWEHAYYVDYRNARPSYVEKFWDIVNWEFAEKNFA